MLPNHAPLHVAEVFHTLEALHPGRIDLGIGRAPGTDPATSRALRPFDAAEFPNQVRELRALSARAFPPDHPFASVRVVPPDVRAAADLGAGVERRNRGLCRLAWASATPSRGTSARRRPVRPIRAYREAFTPVDAVPAAARHPGRVGDVRAHGRRGRLPDARPPTWAGCGCTGASSRRCRAPRRRAPTSYSPQERVVVEMNRLRHFIGTPPKVVSLIRQVLDDVQVDEVMVTSMIYGPAERRRSYELLAREWGLRRGL